MEITTEERQIVVTPNDEMVRDFCLKSLQSRLRGDCANYNEIIEQMSSHTDPDMLLSVFNALPSCISLILRSPSAFSDLLSGVFGYRFLLDDRLSISVISFLGQLVACDATFSLPAFEHLIPNFAVIAESGPRRFEFMHRALRGILALSPASVSHLNSVVIGCFPHKRFSVSIQTQYITQILGICQYCSGLQQPILDVIITKCIEIDVEISIEEGGDVKFVRESSEEDDCQGIFELETDEGAVRPVGRRSAGQSHGREQFTQRIPGEVIDMSEKLDAMTSLLADYIEVQLQSNVKRLQDLVASQLLQIFEERIIMTHKSKFVQFVIFFLCSKYPSAATLFASRLFQLFCDDALSAIKRQSAAMYLASYLSRAAFLPRSVVSDTLCDIITWCGVYVELYDSASQEIEARAAAETQQLQLQQGLVRRSASMPELGRSGQLVLASAHERGSGVFPGNNNYRNDSYGKLHSKFGSHELFYCAFEAACYILCFHGVDLATELKSNEVTRAEWLRVTSHKLQPLRFCLQSVRIEFLKLALYVGLFQDEFWSELNQDILHDDPSNSHARNLSGGANPLDSFFPFDPCLLRMLQKRVEPGFRPWSGSVSLLETSPQIANEAETMEIEDGGFPSSVSSSVSSLAHTYASDIALSVGTGGGQSLSHIYSGHLLQLRRTNRGLSVGSDYTSDMDSLAAAHQVSHSPMTGFLDNGMASSFGGSQTGVTSYISSQGDLTGSDPRTGDEDGSIMHRRPRQYSISSTGSW